MKVAFHSSYLGYRGTEIALMDYAQGNKEVLGNDSLFLMPWREEGENHPVSQRMMGIAPLRFYRSDDEREAILQEERADFFYCIKNGFNDGVFSKRVRTGVHAIFRESEFHGDIYAYVSHWLSEVMTYGKAPWVPHMVRLAEDAGCLRSEGGGRRTEDGGQWADVVVPKDAIVLGRHGGDDSFDIPWVQKAVVETAKKNPAVWFLFMNTRSFSGAKGIPNIQFLPATADPVLKKRFLNTCDAMLHGRMRGETFGLSCLEFAMLGKPVLTYAGSPERAHLEILGDRALPYQNAKELEELLCHPSSVIRPRVESGVQRTEFRGRKTGAFGQMVEGGSRMSVAGRLTDYEPKAVMKKFQEVFLK